MLKLLTWKRVDAGDQNGQNILSQTSVTNIDVTSKIGQSTYMIYFNEGVWLDGAF